MKFFITIYGIVYFDEVVEAVGKFEMTKVKITDKITP